MEDFYYAGLRVSCAGGLLKLEALTVPGETLGQNIEGAQVNNEEVIRAIDKPVSASGGTAVLTETLRPMALSSNPLPRTAIAQDSGAVVFKDCSTGAN